MLHLDAGIHLHEIEITVGIEQKLDGAGPLVTNGASRSDGRFPHALANVWIEGWAGGFLQ